VEYGPGEVTTIHGIDERVSIRSLQCAEEIYQDVILSYC
jgi:succinyl-diaminopimelate desuccinylase